MCSGCFQLTSVLAVKADGSGTIQQRLLFTPAALAQIRGLAAVAGGNGQSFDPVSEPQARAAAAALGPGVAYVSSMPINTPEGQGRDITYAFTDINQLRIPLEPPIPGGGIVGAQGASMNQASFKLTRQPDGNALLRIIVPKPPMPGPTSSAQGGASPLPLDQLAMFKQMLAGARLAIYVEPDGQVVRTSSPHVEGRRVTLIDVALDPLLKDDTVISRLQAARTPDEAKTILEGVPGMKVNFDPEITIEFAPAK